VRLPPLISDLGIDYTALSFVALEKVMFRIKLEGRDREWQDVGNRRQAFYTNLRPGQYRFRVTASNDSGVWNEAGAAVDFSIAPAYYQTIWFRALALMASMVLLWGAYRHRLRQVAYEFDARLQERVHERTRIARELHDTLLQSFHGLLFLLQAATDMLPDRPDEAKQKFERAIDQAVHALTEGRDAVQNLRLTGVDTTDLAAAFTALTEELAAADTNRVDARPVVNVAVEGTPRDLHPVVQVDIYRITGEALRNAFRHARARHIEVEIRYEEKQLHLRVRDDGRGIDLKDFEDRKPGHFGLPGMRERADLIGGRLEVRSQIGIGTEVDLKVPGYAAYSTPGARSRR
jgi:signal transduction histidine kinase